jgi:hypothetical protein
MYEIEPLKVPRKVSDHKILVILWRQAGLIKNEIFLQYILPNMLPEEFSRSLKPELLN